MILILWEKRCCCCCLSLSVVVVNVVVGDVIVAIIQELIVVSRDFSLHVIHTPVAEFDGVGVANFVKSVGLWEGLLDDCQELFSNICFNIFTERGVKPSHFPIPSFCLGRFVSGIGVKF